MECGNKFLWGAMDLNAEQKDCNWKEFKSDITALG
jgi:hypothetical protein